MLWKELEIPINEQRGNLYHYFCAADIFLIIFFSWCKATKRGFVIRISVAMVFIASSKCTSFLTASAVNYRRKKNLEQITVSLVGRVL